MIQPHFLHERRLSYTLFLLPTFLLIILQPSTFVQASSINTQPFLRNQRGFGLDWNLDCIIPLTQVSSDGLLDQTEYTQYVEAMSEEHIPSDQDLPLSLTAVFNNLACQKCFHFFGQDHERCCRKNNVTNEFELDLDPIEGPYNNNPSLKTYIYFVCAETIDTIEGLLAPSAAPSPAPSLNPSSSPSLKPSPSNLMETEVPFMLANTAGIMAEDLINNNNGYMKKLDDAYNNLVSDVLDEMDGILRRTRRMDESGRSLGSLELLNSSIVDIEDEACPDESEPNALCQRMVGHAKIEINQIADKPGAEERVEMEILKSIQAGNLDVNFTVYREVLNPDGGLKVAQISGIVGGAVFLLFATGLFLVTKNRMREHEKMSDDNESAFATRVVDNKSTILGASPTKYGKSSRRTLVGDFSSLSDEDIEANDNNESLPRLESSVEDSLESSSNAGSSGWSSSAGMSSLNTASVDSADHPYNLAMIGAQSGIHNKYQNGDKTSAKFYNIGEDLDSQKSDGNESNDDSLPNNNHNRVKLNTEIEAKDWAAVGATAAILAQSESGENNNSHSSSGRSFAPSNSRSPINNSVDQVRIAELDHLVAAEDWDGIVLAAAKYETSDVSDRDSSSYKSANRSLGDTSGSFASASEGLTNNSSRSLVSDSVSIGSYSGTPSFPSTGTGHGSESPSKNERRLEIRKEVEELVQRVVPEEIDNVDEMMKQFKGREEELVETLRTMQERSIAQREREQMRRNAKREARKSVRNSGNVAPSDTPLTRTAFGVKGEGLPPPGPSAIGIKSTALGGIAGAAAATMHQRIADSKNSVSSVSELSNVSDTNRLNTPTSKNQGTGSKVSSNSPPYTPENDRASDASKISSPHLVDLERAIEAGDWDLVGEAAAKMGEGSISSAATGDFPSVDDSTLESEEKASLTSGSKISSTMTPNTSADITQRAVELEGLIDRGDWAGVVAAASRFSAADRQPSTKGSVQETDSSAARETKQSISGSFTSGSGSGSGWRFPLIGGGSKRSMGSYSQTKGTDADGSRRDGRKTRRTSKEEEDALAEAEIWMQIAKQSKNEGVPGTKGASEAADWAISRSYTALRNAEQQTGKAISSKDRKGLDTVKSGSLSARSSDDGSV